MFSKRLVDPEIIDWQLDGFAWLIDNFENVPGLPETELWLPIPKHYPDAKGRVLADHIFDCVKRQCRFSDEDIFELIAMEGRPDFDLGGLAMIQTEGDTACGTYQFIPKADGGPKEIIRYDAGLGDNPAQLVATFAHELGHALICERLRNLMNRQSFTSFSQILRPSFWALVFSYRMRGLNFLNFQMAIDRDGK